MKIVRGVGFIFCAALLACTGTGTLAQSETNGPAALIISYRAKLGQRATFRHVMATDGIAQLDRWKKDGVFASYQALFTAYAADALPDMFLVVRFKHFADLAGWQKIEMTMPGGLPDKAQDLASANASETADIVKDSRTADTTKDSQFLVLEYDVTADMPKYDRYVEGYIEPQFEGWMKAGALSSYAIFTNQNPAGAQWSSLILLEYKNLEALASRDVIKTKVRGELAASNEAWKRWSDDKTAIRQEKAVIPVLSLH